jgi:hypothetical protein
MHWIAAGLAGLTVVALNVLVWLGVQGLDETHAFHRVLTALNILWPLSAAMLAITLFKRGYRLAATLAASNLLLMVAVLSLSLSGVRFSRGLLFALDLAVLNVLLFLVARYGAHAS